MTQEEILRAIDILKEIVRANITSKTEVDSITPTIHGGVLNELLNFLSELSKENLPDLLTIASMFSEPPSDNVLPTLEGNESKVYFVAKAGTYTTKDGTQKIAVDRGEKALIVYTTEDGENVWKKVSIETIANDINNESTDTPASQYLVKSIRADLVSRINEIANKGYATSEEITNSFVRLDLNNTTEFSETNDAIWQDGLFFFHSNYTGKTYNITGKLLQSLFLSSATTKIVYKKTYLRLTTTVGDKIATITETGVKGFQFETSKLTINGLTRYPTMDYILNPDDTSKLSIVLNGNDDAFKDTDKVVLECYLTDADGGIITE